MNNLNSILIEGEITDAPRSDGRFVCFTIVSSKYSANRNVEKTYVNICVEADLQERAFAAGTVGRGVRIVGRLREYHGIVVMAEHIEYRPVLKEDV